MAPDRIVPIELEVRRYQMLRFGSFFGFRPPYFYSRTLRERLYRAAMPACVIWGSEDRMVPLAHGRAYAEGLRRRLPYRSGLLFQSEGEPVVRLAHFRIKLQRAVESRYCSRQIATLAKCLT